MCKVKWTISRHALGLVAKLGSVVKLTLVVVAEWRGMPQSWVLGTRLWMMKIISPTTSYQHMKRHVHVKICSSKIWILTALPFAYNELNTSLAAAMVKSMSSSVCAKLVKPASYCEGARYTPLSSIPLQYRKHTGLQLLVTNKKKTQQFHTYELQ